MKSPPSKLPHARPLWTINSKPALERQLSMRLTATEITHQQYLELRAYHMLRLARQSERRKGLGKKRNYNYRFWQELLEPLLKEISHMRNRVGYYNKTDNDEAVMVYEDYLNALLRLRDMFRVHQRGGMSIAETRVQYEKQHLPPHKHLPNFGRHWTDWVSPKAKRRAAIRIANLPGNHSILSRHAPFGMQPMDMLVETAWHDHQQRQKG